MTENRRDVSSRKIPFFNRLAQKLVKAGLHPNHISVMSTVFALMGGVALAQAGRGTFSENLCYVIIALVGIQLRLVCNLIDGLMAVEGGLKTPTGELYNDIPDRFSDIFILVGAGYSALSFHPIMVEVAWMAAVAAVLTAYIRVLGASMGAKHYFAGPMAKQHRMFLMNVALTVSLVESYFSKWGMSLALALTLVFFGSLFTCIRRLKMISKEICSKI